MGASSTNDQDGPPDDPQTYANFLSLLLNKVGGVVDAVEVWNEPNLIREWTGSLPFSGAGYMQLFNAGVSGDPRLLADDARLSLPGWRRPEQIPVRWTTAPFSSKCTPPGWEIITTLPLAFIPIAGRIRRMRPAAGRRAGMTIRTSSSHDTLNDYRQMMVNNGQSDLQLWVTEFGWATWDGFPGQPPAGSEWMLRNTKWDQANYTIRAFQIGQQTPYIGPMILWNLNFATLAGLVANGDERIAYSIVLPGKDGVIDNNSTDTTERPLYWMIYDAVRPDTHLPSYD